MGLREVVDVSGDGPVEVVLERDTAVRMARVLVGGVVAYEGNYGDFYPTCHSRWTELEAEQGGWRGANGFCAALAGALSARGREPSLREGAYRYVR